MVLHESLSNSSGLNRSLHKLHKYILKIIKDPEKNSCLWELYLSLFTTFEINIDQVHLLVYFKITKDLITCKHFLTYFYEKKKLYVLESYKAVKLRLADIFSKILKVFAWTLKFVIGKKCCQLFFLKWQPHFIHFWENVCQMPTTE